MKINPSRKLRLKADYTSPNREYVNYFRIGAEILSIEKGLLNDEEKLKNVIEDVVKEAGIIVNYKKRINIKFTAKKLIDIPFKELDLILKSVKPSSEYESYIKSVLSKSSYDR